MLSFYRHIFLFTYLTCIILFTEISVSYNITNIWEWTYNNNWRVILPVELYTPPGRPSFAPCIHWQQPWRKSTFAPIPLQNTKRANPLSWRVRNQSQQSYRVFSVLWLFYASLHIVTTVQSVNLWALVSKLYKCAIPSSLYFFLNTNTMYMVLYLQLSIDL